MRDNSILFVSFYTPSYAKEASLLARSLLDFELPHEISSLREFGSWEAAIHHKPVHLLDSLQRHGWNCGGRYRAIVWLDADARVRKFPDRFYSLDCDVAAHFRRRSQAPRNELISATMYFACNDRSRAVLEDWTEENRLNPTLLDQANLQTVLRTAVPQTAVQTLSFNELPAEYCAVMDQGDLPDGYFPHVNPCQVVIEQLQASRRLKKR